MWFLSEPKFNTVKRIPVSTRILSGPACTCIGTWYPRYSLARNGVLPCAPCAFSKALHCLEGQRAEFAIHIPSSSTDCKNICDCYRHLVNNQNSASKMDIYEEIFEDNRDALPEEFEAMTADDVLRRIRLLDNEIRVLKDESTRLSLEQSGLKEKVCLLEAKRVPLAGP